MKLKIDKKFVILFLIYYILILLMGLYSIYTHFFNPIPYEDYYNLSFNLKQNIILYSGRLIVLLSLVSIVIGIIYRQPKILLIYPIYNLIYFIIWLNAVPFFISDYYYPSTELAWEKIILISKYDFITYFLIFGFLFIC